MKIYSVIFFLAFLATVAKGKTLKNDISTSADFSGTTKLPQGLDKLVSYWPQNASYPLANLLSSLGSRTNGSLENLVNKLGKALSNGDFLTNTSRLIQDAFSKMNVSSQLKGLMASWMNSDKNPKQGEDIIGNLLKDKNLQKMVMELLPPGLLGNNSSPINMIGKLFQDANVQRMVMNLLPPEMKAFLSPQQFSGLGRISAFLRPLLKMFANGVASRLEGGLQELNVSAECANNTARVLTGMLAGEFWSFGYLDAIGKPNSGLLEGAFLWMGSFHECLNVKPPSPGEFTGNYCLLKIPIPMSLVGAMAGGDGSSQQQGGAGIAGAVIGASASLTYGLCVPKSCSAADVEAMVGQGLLGKLPDSVYGNNTPAVNPVCHQEDRHFEHDTRGIAVVAVLAVIGFIILAGTVYDVVSEQIWQHNVEKSKKKCKDHELHSASNGFTHNWFLHKGNLSNGHVNNAYEQDGIKESQTNVYVISEKETDDKLTSEPEVVIPTENGNVIDNYDNKHDIKPQPEVTVPNGKLQNHKEEPTPQKRPKPGILGGLLLAFSLYTNSKKLLNADQRSGMLGAVNGVRFLSMAWVVLGHTYFFHITIQNNIGGYGVDFQSRWTAQGILNATVSVDSFFTLSGLLVAYLTLTEMGKRKSAKINWFMFYFHRFWRLTPPYMLIIMTFESLMQYWGSGALWPAGSWDLTSCTTSWWRNLLYINNFHMENSCIGWSWYLANDMQFFVISPLILVPLFYSKIAGLCILGLFFLGTFIATGIISHDNGFMPNDFRPEYMDEVYIKPWCRIGPYLVGLLVGYLLFVTKGKVKLHRSTVVLGWCAAIVTSLATLYGLYGTVHGGPLNIEEAAVYNALFRTTWGAGLGWLLFACCTGYGGIINTFLSWKPFIPLARLTYMTYLVHPIVMMYFNYSTPNAYHMSDVTISYLFVGNMFFSYFIAFMVSLVFEAPMMGLERVIFRK